MKRPGFYRSFEGNLAKLPRCVRITWMVLRQLLQKVYDALDFQPAVVLLGPRQVGKTTLAMKVAAERAAVYLDLENPVDRAKLLDAEAFLSSYEDRLIILDEIHRIPNLFPTIRGLVDVGRRRGKRSGRFLFLGSASMDLMRQSGESLAGRVRYLELAPFAISEVPDDEIKRIWIRGGFPESFLAEDDNKSIAWRVDLIRTYLERDIPQLGPRIPAETLRRFWTMLAHGQGGLFNSSRLAAGLEISGQTVGRYVDLLVDLLLVRRLQPFTVNVGKRLIKSPKVLIRDSGLVHALLNIDSYDAILGNPVVGGSWEGFVIENLINAAPERTVPGFYRTSGGAEIDLLLEFPGGELWAVEIKRSATTKPGRGFYSACDDLGPVRRLLVHARTDRFPMGSGVEAIGICELVEEVRAFS